jgi:hypothetical protein
MKEQIIVSLILLALACIDAIGDGLRIRKYQVPHHIMEALHLAVFFAVWKLFGFEWIYIPIYLTGRVWAFNPVLNLVSRFPLFYVGNSNIYDRILSLIGGWVKSHPGHFAFITQFMALLAWIGLTFII